jgi:hypothetical protein
MKIEKYKEQARLLFESFLRESNFLTDDVRQALHSDDAAYLTNWSSSLDNSVVRDVTRTYLTTRENLEAERTLLDSAEQLRVSSRELDQHIKVVGSRIAELHSALIKLTETSKLFTRRKKAAPWYLYDA